MAVEHTNYRFHNAAHLSTVLRTFCRYCIDRHHAASSNSPEQYYRRSMATTLTRTTSSPRNTASLLGNTLSPASRSPAQPQANTSPSPLAAAKSAVASVTPSKSPTPGTPTQQPSSPALSTPGAWQHPRMDEVLRRRDANRVDKSHMQMIALNLALLILTFLTSTITRSMYVSPRPFLLPLSPPTLIPSQTPPHPPHLTNLPINHLLHPPPPSRLPNPQHRPLPRPALPSPGPLRRHPPHRLATLPPRSPAPDPARHPDGRKELRHPAPLLPQQHPAIRPRQPAPVRLRLPARHAIRWCFTAGSQSGWESLRILLPAPESTRRTTVSSSSGGGRYELQSTPPLEFPGSHTARLAARRSQRLGWVREFRVRWQYGDADEE